MSRVHRRRLWIWWQSPHYCTAACFQHPHWGRGTMGGSPLTKHDPTTAARKVNGNSSGEHTKVGETRHNQQLREIHYTKMGESGKTEKMSKKCINEQKTIVAINSIGKYSKIRPRQRAMTNGRGKCLKKKICSKYISKRICTKYQ